MTRLLMLDSDPHLLSAVTRALEQHGVEVFGVRSVALARDGIAKGDFDAALLDCDLLEPIDLASFAGVRLILSTSYLEPEGEHSFFREARLLRKPFTSAQLLSALHDSRAGLHAEPQGLLDVLRQAHGDGLTFCLHYDGAQLYVERGELVHAERDGLVGECALAELLSHAQASLLREQATSFIRVDAKPAERTIHRPFRTLMLDLLRRLEEGEDPESDSAPAKRPPPKVDERGGT